MKVPSGVVKSTLFWIAGLALVVTLFALAMRQIAADQLLREAERSASSWADFARSTVPDFEEIFTGLDLSPDAHVQLQRLRHATDVFRFKLFDREGQPLLLSDDLALPTAAIPSPRAAESHPAPAQVLGGARHIALKRSTREDRPAVYSEAYVPVLRGDRVIGVVEVYVDQAERAAGIERAFMRIAGAVSAMLALLIVVACYQIWARARRQKQAEARVRYLADHDALSGSLNRSSFQEILQHAAWRHSNGSAGFALLRIDLDHFKHVNDALGHAVGDEVLRQVAHRLNDAVRHGDHVARLDGDEFAILQTGVVDAGDVSSMGERIVKALAVPYEVGARRVHCTASVGATIHGVDATDPEELMHRADLALYRAKAAGRGAFSFYDAAMDEGLQARRALIHDLREAIGSDQMSLDFQPLFERDGCTLVGYEALARWRHPTRGVIPPSDFIPLAEDSGSIDALSHWVLKRACADAAHWPHPLSVAVNLSAAQFRQGDLVDVVAEALATTGLLPERLELEITESLLMSNTEHVLSTLRALSAMGVRIAMDDFGTGYSSLAYLWRFPFHKVKIDRAFTKNLAEDPKVNLIVRSIISLAHSLDIRVNAEGVETPTQMAALQQHGCDELQGYLLGRPGPLLGPAEARNAMYESAQA